VQVAVAEGKVSVKQREADVSSGPVMLEPDQWVTYNNKSRELQREQGDIRELIAWKDGILLFHDKTVSEVTGMLERWYNTTIVVQEEAVKNCLIHGEYKDNSLETVLKMMQFTLDVDYAFTEEGVIISGGGCQ
jgi:transmembrane sensor